MKRLLSWLMTLVLISVVAVVALVSWVYLSSERRMVAVYDVPTRQLEVSLEGADPAEGERLARIWGCADCHGPDLGGTVVVDAPPMTLVAPNLTTGHGSTTAAFEDADWVRAIRHGVRPDGRPLVFMPSAEYWVLSNEDVAAMIAYLRSVPPVDRVHSASVVRGLGRFLFATGRLPLISAEAIDHEAPRPRAPQAAETAAYGEYLASGCKGCHGAALAGGPIPGGPPEWPPASNLTQDPADGLGGWSRDNFFAALRTGKRPDGTDIDSTMPWRNTALMTDVELGALWAYLQTVPAARAPVPEGGESN